MKDQVGRIYFPGLNGLRFLAAFAVVVTHIELLKGQIGLPNHWLNPLVFNLGGLGVYFFFVLSGFLITYLLLAEKSATGSISVKDFYIRRVLRIWPLYYLLVILGFFVFPYFDILKLDWPQKHFEQSFWLKFLLNLFMLPNLAMAMFPAMPHIGQAWSIGVEEQFYLLWPWLLKSSRKFLRTLGYLFMAIISIKCITLYVSYLYPHSNMVNCIKAFVAMSKIECMAIGGFGAYFLFEKNGFVLALIYNWYLQVLSFLALPFLIFYTPDPIQDGIHIVYSFFFIVIIINVSSNPSSIFKFENKVFNFLGSISYGLYMYHMFIAVLMIRVSNAFLGKTDGYLFNLACYLLTIVVTIFVSWLSFRFFELPFSRRRKNYSSIVSGMDVNTLK
jgi:peptidoglycan/LPS O-acetylase OafA/YrhL